mgnify:CR=1 FL=1
MNKEVAFGIGIIAGAIILFNGGHWIMATFVSFVVCAIIEKCQ